VQWGKLTDDDFEVVAGRCDQLAGKIQERYGVAKDEAEKQVAEWQRKVSVIHGSLRTRLQATQLARHQRLARRRGGPSAS